MYILEKKTDLQCNSSFILRKWGKEEKRNRNNRNNNRTKINETKMRKLIEKYQYNQKLDT